MSKLTFSKLVNNLNLKVNKDIKNIVDTENNVLFEVLQYLPIDEKTKFLQFVVNGALDERTGCFSPLRVEVYYSIAICKWYAGINFSDKQLSEIGKTYDLLESNNIIGNILDSIPKDEKEFMRELVNDTIKDIARFNSSAAGIIQQMSTNTEGLDSQLTEILDKIKNGENLETLNVIKDVVGKD